MERWATPPDDAYTIEDLARLDCPFMRYDYDEDAYFVRPEPGYFEWREPDVLAILTDTGYGDKGGGKGMRDVWDVWRVEPAGDGWFRAITRLYVEIE